MEVKSRYRAGNVNYVVSYKEYVLANESTKALVVIGIVAVMRSICSKYVIKTVAATYLTFLLRSE
jgi:hypothetical protein